MGVSKKDDNNINEEEESKEINKINEEDVIPSEIYGVSHGQFVEMKKKNQDNLIYIKCIFLY